MDFCLLVIQLCISSCLFRKLNDLYFILDVVHNIVKPKQNKEVENIITLFTQKAKHKEGQWSMESNERHKGGW